MRISFVLPAISKDPVGGFKIVFEYANRLSEKGHRVCILFDCSKTLKKYHQPKLIRKIYANFLSNYYPKWFCLRKDIRRKGVIEWKDHEIPDADAIIATAHMTVKSVAQLDKSKGKKFYFIQGFEIWDGTSEETIFETYKLGMTNIVIAKWLKRIVDKYSKEPAIYIPNGLDFSIFDIDIPIEERNIKSVVMLYHSSEVKGSKYGIQCLEILKKKFPEMKACLFGVPERPEILPEWIEYIQNASSKQLRRIYNQSSIFICPTTEEGFGLTGAESMACGCALVSTEYLGVLEYARNGENALLSPVKDAKLLADNVERLFVNDELRRKLAKQGSIDIRSLSWEASVSKFNNILKN